MQDTSTFTGVQSKGAPAKPGFLILQTAAKAQRWLWVDSTGDLRIHTAEPTSYDVDGTIVGTQS